MLLNLCCLLPFGTRLAHGSAPVFLGLVQPWNIVTSLWASAQKDVLCSSKARESAYIEIVVLKQELQ